MATSVTLRRGFVKVKRGRLTPKSVLRNDEKFIDEAAKPSTPLLAVRLSPHPLPKPWWSRWRMIATVAGLVFFTVPGIYVLSQTVKFNDDSNAGRGVATSIDMSYPTRGAGFQPGKGKRGESGWGSLSDYSAPTTDSFSAAFGGSHKQPDSTVPTTDRLHPTSEGSHKLVLNQYLSGNCVIGVNVVQNLQDCLERKSASATK